MVMVNYACAYACALIVVRTDQDSMSNNLNVLFLYVMLAYSY